MVYDKCQLRVVQNIIMKIYIADTTEMWAGESALFVCK